jgi:hypothetical protein
MNRNSVAVMDPLKMVYGVKRPLEDKEEKIKDLPNQ